MENNTTQNNIKTYENLDQVINYLIKMPPHTTINIPKTNLTNLPKSFQKTFLGYSKEGELSQYRGPENIHVHEMIDNFELHRDNFDPRNIIGAIGHAFADAPEIGFGVAVGLTSGIAVGKFVYDSKKDSSENAGSEAAFWGILIGFGLGLLTFLAMKVK